MKHFLLPFLFICTSIFLLDSCSSKITKEKDQDIGQSKPNVTPSPASPTTAPAPATPPVMTQKEEKSELKAFKKSQEKPVNKKAFKNAQYFFKLGSQAARNKQWEQAVANYDSALAKDPSFKMAYFYRGQAKEQMSDHLNAHEDYTAAIRNNYKKDEAYHLRGNIRLQLNDYKGALSDFDSAILVNSNRKDYKASRALAKMSSKDFSGAYEDLLESKEEEDGGNVDTTAKKLVEALANYNYAEKQMEAKNDSTALQFLNRALELAPDNGYFYYKRAELLADMNDTDGAMADYTRSIEKEQDPEAYHGRGLVKFQLVDINGAIKDYDDAIKKDSLFSEAYLNRGIAKVEINDTEGAIQDFTSAIEVKKYEDEGQEQILDAIAYFERGKCYEKQGKYPEALEDFNKSLQLDPTNGGIYYERAVCKAQLGDFDGSLEDYSKAIEADKMAAESYNNRGLIKLQLVDYEGSISDFSKAYEKDTTFSEALVNRATAKTESGDLEGALQDYDKAIEKGFVKKEKKRTGETKTNDPHKHSHALTKRAYAKYKLGKYKEAISDYDQAIGVNDTNAQAYYYRANAKNATKDVTGALADYDKAISLTPNNAKIYFNKATLYSEQLNYPLALVNYDKAIEINSQFMQAFHNRAAIKEEMKQFEAAIKDYDRSIDLEKASEDPMLKESYKHRGICKAKIGQQGACEDLSVALQMKAEYAQSFVNKYCK
jgi:tetratricopeptide (TPR) repeat protein